MMVTEGLGERVRLGEAVGERVGEGETRATAGGGVASAASSAQTRVLRGAISPRALRTPVGGGALGCWAARFVGARQRPTWEARAAKYI